MQSEMSEAEMERYRQVGRKLFGKNFRGTLNVDDGGHGVPHPPGWSVGSLFSNIFG